MTEENKHSIMGNLLAPVSLAENVVSAVFLRFGPTGRSKRCSL